MMSTKYAGAPHPDYPAMVWSVDSVEALVLAVIEEAATPAAAVAGIMQVLDSVGYDSIDREMAFWIATQTKGWDYDDLYDVWIGS